jgi:hypothetical protein
MLRRAALSLLIFATLLMPTRSFAQSAADIAARRDLLSQAQSASDSGDHARALDLGQRAGAIQFTPSLRLFVAQEQQHVGQLAAALGNAELCTRDAHDDTQLANREAIMSACRDLATAIRPTVAHVVVHVPSPTPAGLEVRIGDATLNPAFYGQSYVVDPGTVHVSATSTGAVPFATDVTIARGGTQEVNVQLTPSPNAPVATGTQPSESSGAPGNAPPSATPPASGPGIGPFVVAGAGVLVFATSGIFYGLQQSSLSHCRDAGPGAATCAGGDASDAVTWNTLTNTAFVAGGVIVAAGVAWYLVARLTSHRSEVHAAFAPAQGGGLLMVGGSL